MGSEVLIYGYGIVCLCMLAYNLCYSVHLRLGDRRQERRVRWMGGLMEAQLARIKEGQPVLKWHLPAMQSRLIRLNNLLAMQQFLQESTESPQVLGEYFLQTREMLLNLAEIYAKREDTQTACFCHLLTINAKFVEHSEIAREPVLLRSIRKQSLYCRVNALKALCAFCSAQGVYSAFRFLARGEGTPIHEKVLVEALLTHQYPGALIGLLWQGFDHFAPAFQRAALDYIRFQSGDYCQEMLRVLTDETLDKEVRLSAIRYFGRYPYEPARQVLIDLVKNFDPVEWEYAAISASSLARYYGGEVERVLTAALRSVNWYVRQNAAASLEAHGVSYGDLTDIVTGSDRYARETLTYRLETRRLKEKYTPPSEAPGAEGQEGVLAAEGTEQNTEVQNAT